jgi:hypothetical protein
MTTGLTDRQAALPHQGKKVAGTTGVGFAYAEWLRN